MTPSVFAPHAGPLTSERSSGARAQHRELFYELIIIRESVDTGRLASWAAYTGGAAQVVHVIGDIGGVDVVDDGYAFQH
jgi:hypothetical protein